VLSGEQLLHCIKQQQLLLHPNMATTWLTKHMHDEHVHCVAYVICSRNSYMLPYSAAALAGSINAQLHASDSLQAPTPVAAAAVSGAAPSMPSARNSGRSRSRMLNYFRGYQGLSAGAGMFNGLRVRMGVVTGVVDGPAEASAALANIMNSSLYKLALGSCCCIADVSLLFCVFAYLVLWLCDVQRLWGLLQMCQTPATVARF
jgi:hypothetical protein